MHIYLKKELEEKESEMQQYYKQKNKTKVYYLKTMNHFPDWISKTNNTQVDNAKEQYLVMPMYNVIVYDNNYSKISENL